MYERPTRILRCAQVLCEWIWDGRSKDESVLKCKLSPATRNCRLFSIIESLHLETAFSFCAGVNYICVPLEHFSYRLTCFGWCSERANTMASEQGQCKFTWGWYQRGRIFGAWVYVSPARGEMQISAFKAYEAPWRVAFRGAWWVTAKVVQYRESRSFMGPGVTLQAVLLLKVHSYLHVWRRWLECPTKVIRCVRLQKHYCKEWTMMEGILNHVIAIPVDHVWVDEEKD